MILEVERQPTRWSIALDRADKANALSAELVEALIAIVAEAAVAAVPVLVFEGNGRNFSAGFDFTDYEAQSEGDLLLRFVRIETLLQAVVRSPCLTVALAHGRNFGAGVDLVAACRWRIAAPETTFRMPGLAFGLVLGTSRFAGLVGREAAREILEGLKTFDAQSALSLRFVRDIAPAEEWPGVVADAEKTASRLSPADRAVLYGTLDEGEHDADLAALARSASAPGIKERIRSYLAR